jgi:hypothetical protein
MRRFDGFFDKIRYVEENLLTKNPRYIMMVHRILHQELGSKIKVDEIKIGCGFSMFQLYGFLREMIALGIIRKSQKDLYFRYDEEDNSVAGIRKMIDDYVRRREWRDENDGRQEKGNEGRDYKSY